MQIKKLISYLTCEKFKPEIYKNIEKRYKCNNIKDAIIIDIKDEQQIILFKYGVFVCWNIEFDNLKFFLDLIKDFQINSFQKPIIEELNYTFDNEFKINLDTIYLDDFSSTSKSSLPMYLVLSPKYLSEPLHWLSNISALNFF